LQDGEHVGKVTVDIENVSNLPFGPYPHKKLIFHPQFSYLLTGGLGGLGKSILTWMAERGARNFVILSRSAGASQCDKDFISELETMSCTIILVAGKVENQEAVSRAVASAPTPIRGVFHLAMVQREGPILDMSYQDWTDVIQPKVDGAWNLHNELAGGELDFFILASSMLALVNQPHESNYAAASRFLESFCQYRRGLELPASILSICPITDVGFLADRPAMRRDLQQQGFYFLGEREFLDFVELAILNQRPRNDSKRGGNQAYGGVSVNEGWIGMGLRSLVPLSDPRNRIHWQNDPRMGYFHNVFATTTTTTSTSESSIATFLTAARADPSILSQGSTHELLSQEILRHLQSVLMTTEEHVGVDVSPQSLGVDSLLGIELKRWWMLTFGVEMGTLEVLGSKSVRELGILTATKLAAKIGA
jgi:NAD(P)-dependent dehydrogenase (short-subunit alcohol dehydrogenase family)